MTTDSSQPLTTKDAFFLVSNELGWEERYQANKLIIPNLQIAPSTGTIFQSINDLKEKSTTDLFVLVDGDSLLLPDASMLTAVNSPSVFYSVNKYGIKYGHGGVKILNKNRISDSGSASDMTSRMALSTITHVASSHDFHFSEFNTWKTLFKELMKLYLWGESRRLHEWLVHSEPKSVFSLDVIPFIRGSSIQDLLTVITNHQRLLEIFGDSKSCFSSSLGEDAYSDL